MAGVSLDLRKAHASHRFGDIYQILTWVNDERAMVLAPALRRGAPWFIVCDSAAWKYDNKHYLAQKAKEAADVLGMSEGGVTAWVKIATIIHDGLADLIKMPSRPPVDFLNANIGDMTMRADGKTFAQDHIKIEDDGAEYVQSVH